MAGNGPICTANLSKCQGRSRWTPAFFRKASRSLLPVGDWLTKVTIHFTGSG